MKTTAIILLAVLILLPIMLRITVFAKLLKRTGNNSNQSQDKHLNPAKIKLYKVLGIIFFICYILSILAIFLWIEYMFSQSAVVSPKFMFFSGISLFILLLFFAGYIFFYYRYFIKKNPLPSAGSDNKNMLGWENTNYDLLSKNLWRILSFYIGGIIILVGLIGLAAYFISR
jgi:hypothetical protein